ncbi:MAG: hypothetical protein Q8L49_05865 [Burkholderiaceae bacterium]|nr:hypothetical protein [Burkholderiaceae bacterium]
MHQLHSPAALTRRGALGALACAAGLIGLGGCATSAQAHQGLVGLEIVDRDSNQVLPTYAKDGRQFVAGRSGARYALRLRNLTHARVLVVLAVDGINVISGANADWQQVGYVLDAGRSYDINGWRKSGSEIAAFEFAPIERSYAALTGRPGNVGVIGVAAFRERPQPAPAGMAPARSERRADAPAPGALGAVESSAMEKSAATDATGSRLGTGHGQREWSVIERTDFVRASATPDQVREIEYDSRERLVAAGVIAEPQAYARPRAFPANTGGFVPDPPAR